MEENKKPIYLEELEETSGQKLDRYGLTPEQRKQYEKDKKLDKLKTRLPIYIWLLVGVITGVVLYLCKPLFSLDETQIKTMNIVVCMVAGIAWWGIFLLIFKRKLTNMFTKIIDKKKANNKIKYELLPFTKSNNSPKTQHKEFIRCPLCGHKLKITDTYSNDGKIYETKLFVEKDKYGITVSEPFKMLIPSKPLEEHTCYKCSHCDFSFKASYKGEYVKDDRIVNVKKYSVVHTNKISLLDDKVKMDEEAENILKPYENKKFTDF